MNIFRGKSTNLVFFLSPKTICELKFSSKLGVVFKASNRAKITRKISVMSLILKPLIPVYESLPKLWYRIEGTVGSSFPLNN